MVRNKSTMHACSRKNTRAREKPKIRKTTSWSRSLKNGWTQERKTRQAGLIHNWKPWQRSTGPRTLAGKARVSQNAYKGGTRPLLRRLARLLREQKQAL